LYTIYNGLSTASEISLILYCKVETIHNPLYSLMFARYECFLCLFFFYVHISTSNWKNVINYIDEAILKLLKANIRYETVLYTTQKVYKKNTLSFKLKMKTLLLIRKIECNNVHVRFRCSLLYKRTHVYNKIANIYTTRVEREKMIPQWSQVSLQWKKPYSRFDEKARACVVPKRWQVKSHQTNSHLGQVTLYLK